MNGQRVGYIRVSTLDQNPDRQLDGLQLDRTFRDRASVEVKLLQTLAGSAGGRTTAAAAPGGAPGGPGRGQVLGGH